MMPLVPPPVDYDAMRLALVSVVQTATGLDGNSVMMAEPEVPNAPRPPLPYATIKFTSPGLKYGDDAPVDVLDSSGQVTGTYTYGGPRGVAVSVNAYGTTHEQAYGIMGALQAALDLEPIVVQLRAAGIAVWSIGAVTDLSELLNTGWEGRAHLDCVFGVASNTTAVNGLVGAVNVAASVDDGTGKLLPLTASSP